MVTFIIHIVNPEALKVVGSDAAEFQELMRREIIPRMKKLQVLSAKELGLPLGTRFKI